MVASFTHSKSKISTIIILHCFLLLAATSAQLSSDYYSKSCANALSIIQSVVQATVKNEARMGASLTRLHFHDCFVNGCDASNLLDDNANFTGEKTASPNINSARGFEVIDTIKSQLEEACPGVVSCADIIAVAARDSVVALGGPRWTVLLGRRDSTTASLHAANSSIPGPFFNLSALIRSFSNKGLTSKEMVTLAGAHTIGRARCVIYRTHIYGDNNINSSFATSLQANCPRTSGNNNSSPLDLISSTTFDNAYYINLMNQRGLLHSDQQFFSGNGGSIDDHVSAYASNSSYFFTEFANAMVKMGNIGVLTGSSGQVRNHCRKIN